MRKGKHNHEVGVVDRQLQATDWLPLNLLEMHMEYTVECACLNVFRKL
jgi:hypothetical protein